MKPYAMYLMVAVFALSAVFTACEKKDEPSKDGNNQPPTCTITNPKDNAEIGIDKNISVTVDAEDDDGKVVEVQLFLDDVGHSIKTEFPYNFVITAGELEKGAHTLRAVAKDDQGAKTEASVNIVIVEAGKGDNQPPTCTISAPQNNAQFGTDKEIAVAVIAEDVDGSVVEVQLLVDNVAHSVKTASPYNFTIEAGTLPVGSHTLKAVAKDDQDAKTEATVAIIITQPGENKAPTCTITNPQNNSEYSTDENVPVTVVAEDADGYIVEVQLYVDNVGHSIKTSFPYNFTINSGELSVGTHTLRAVAKDNEGANGESTVTITIKQPDTESPDFVSFSDGKIPNTWKTTAWFVDTPVGYDDIYSLKASAPNVAVITSKTVTSAINGIEFYVRSGSVNFFIDGEKMLECSSDKNWKKYSMFLEEGLHTLKWESSSNSVNIDAIRFKKMDFAIGMPYQGGIIAYVDNSEQHGLIAAPYDQSEGIQWSNGYYITTGATGTAIGTGKNNTEKIIQAQGAGNYAAKICDDLTIDGYSDWFLPSKDELNELYKNRYVIGESGLSYYWSSSEYDYDDAWCQGFSNGTQSYSLKYNAYRVRAVRAF